jgi:hypothetical protein
MYKNRLINKRLPSFSREARDNDIVLIKGIALEDGQAGYFYLRIDPTKELLFEKEMSNALSNRTESIKRLENKAFLKMFYGIQIDPEIGSSVDLGHYGNVILSGYSAEPPMDVKNYMKEKFGFE